MEAAERGYILGYSFSSTDMAQSALYNNITSNRVDGAVVMGRFNQDFLKLIKNNVSNLVYAGLNCVNGGFDEVICDAYKAAIFAVEYFISLGHRKIGYIGSIPELENSAVINEHRFDGFRYAMERNGLEVQMSFIRGIELSTRDGYIAMKSMLDEGQLPSALFCANDSVAIGVMKAIHEAGFKIPHDMALIGIDDIEMSAFVRPALTTIHVPKVELGRFAAKILIDRIEGGHQLPVRVDLPFELKIRESCGGKI